MTAKEQFLTVTVINLKIVFNGLSRISRGGIRRGIKIKA